LMRLPLQSCDRHKLLKHKSLCHYFNFLKRWCALLQRWLGSRLATRDSLF
jgi:hypothetical protein